MITNVLPCVLRITVHNNKQLISRVDLRSSQWRSVYETRGR